MKKNILLTSFGGTLSWEFYQDFKRRNEYRVFIGDIDLKARARVYAKDFIKLLPAENNEYCKDLLIKAKKLKIKMIIPGADREALALMEQRDIFQENGIIVSVQDKELLPFFLSKSAMYDHLKEKGFPVPFYVRFKTMNEFESVLKNSGYPSKPLLIKPNSGRGGRGIVILSEKVISNPDNLQLHDIKLFKQIIDEKTDFLAMDYIEGTIFDVDVLTYQNGRTFFCVRRRFHNVTKLFSGNAFEDNEDVIRFSKKIYEVLPTKFLIDYDIMVAPDGNMTLLEINPRPSGSTISYLPFGVNLYDTLIKSYIEKKHQAIRVAFLGKSSFSFLHMIKGQL